MGGHTHTALSGTQVHVWVRGGTYLARGRYQRRPFGQTLGDDVAIATARLRQLLTEVENGSYVRPSDACKRPLSTGAIPRVNLRQLVNEFLAEKRKLRGQQTAGDYKSRLLPVLAFAEEPSTRTRWPLAADIDREFVVSLRAFLHRHKTTPNGRTGGTPKLLSPRQVINVLQCLRSLFAWAANPSIRRLPPDWVSPLTPDLIDQPATKDPLRVDKLPLDARIKIVHAFDAWQLVHLVFSVVLPLRPDEAAGLLISDVNFEHGWLEFGHQFKDCNFSKEGTAFKVPFCAELRPILHACIGDRREGPLLRSRKAFQKHVGDNGLSTDDLRRLFEESLIAESRDAIQAAHDRKRAFRRLLRRLGGISEDAMAKEFRQVLALVEINNGATLYTLRGSVTSTMKDAGLPHLEMRYVTSHSTNDILNQYASLDPVGVMQKYFERVRPLLEAITERVSSLGLPVG
jgi:integrase